MFVNVDVADSGPSSMSKAQLVHQLVQDFPKAFQLVTIHSTPAYGQAAHDDASAGGDSIVSSAEFQVRVPALQSKTSPHFAVSWPAHQHQTAIFPCRLFYP